MNRLKKYKNRILLPVCIVLSGCKLFTPIPVPDKQMPQAYVDAADSTNTAMIKWKDFFNDKNLVSLIDTAIKNNPDMMMALQDVEIAKNNVRLRKGMLFPKAEAGIGYGIDKVGRYTSEGAGDAATEITPGQLVPDPLQDYFLGLNATWEVDIWQKLRNKKRAAAARYLGTVEGKNFVLTGLISEIANAYYELLALDSQLDIIRQTIDLQKNALEIVKIQKQASEANELAVKKFEAEVSSSQSMEFEVLQKIKENENEINFLLGRFPQPIVRDKSIFMSQLPQQVKAGIPSQLLANRPDIREAKLALYAAGCDVKSAQAEFYPSFTINGSAGFRAFNLAYFLSAPESIIYSLAGDLAAPLINRSAIKAEFKSAKAEQLKAMYEYQKSVLDGYVEVSNQLSAIGNLEKSYDLKNKQVEALVSAIDISNDLFRAGRADYLEVLMTQRDALESKLELIETREKQLNAVTNIYRALGGGWK